MRAQPLLVEVLESYEVYPLSFLRDLLRVVSSDRFGCQERLARTFDLHRLPLQLSRRHMSCLKGFRAGWSLEKAAFLLHDEIALVKLHFKNWEGESLVGAWAICDFVHFHMSVVRLLSLHNLLSTLLKVNVFSRHNVVVRFFGLLWLFVCLDLRCGVGTYLRVWSICLSSVLFFRARLPHSVRAMLLEDLSVRPRVC